MLSLDFADIAIIDTMETNKIIIAIVPNSGITKVPIISIVSAPAKNGTVTVLPLMITSFASSPSISTMNIPLCVDSDGLIVNVPSSTADKFRTIELLSRLKVVILVSWNYAKS